MIHSSSDLTQRTIVPETDANLSTLTARAGTTRYQYVTGFGAAACFGAKPEECVGLEDSFNGLRAVRASGAFTLGLATTNSREAIAPFSDYVIDDYQDFGYEDLCKVVDERGKK